MIQPSHDWLTFDELILRAKRPDEGSVTGTVRNMEHEVIIMGPGEVILEASVASRSA